MILKTLNLDRVHTLFLLLCLMMFGSYMPAHAQTGSIKVTGKVIDEQKEPMIGVTVMPVSSKSGAITDLDGNFSLSVPKGTKQLQISFVGYKTTLISIPESNNVNVQLVPDAKVLNDVVVIGYGTQRKSDLTGSVSNVSNKDFNGGMINSPEQLINGKVSGVQITNGGGSPTDGSTIRIRGGASLNASNDPLVVIDGVPLEVSGSIAGSGNFLSLINPNDIESITILKDASSTAIYGSRASNGVIILTTKKGSSGKVRISFSTTNSVQTRTKVADMLSYDDFKNIITTQGSAAQQALLGTYNTDWNKQIYKTAFGTDNNLSVSGRTGFLPYRVSLGYYNQDGILKTDNATRYTGNLTLSPSFFNDYLKFNLSLKGSVNNNRFANQSAIWGAATYNPTIPVYSGTTNFGGYNEAIDNKGIPVTGAVLNPLGVLQQTTSKGNVKRIIGNFDVDYKFHFLPDLRLHATLGYDYAEGKSTYYVPADAASYFNTGGADYTYGKQRLTNKLLTTYLTYNKYLENIKSNIEVTAGYDFQKWMDKRDAYTLYNCAGVAQSTSAAIDQRHVLLSYYGRVNYSYDSRYLLTATMRRDGSSRFSKDNRWGTFPSVALGWRVTEESFLKNNPILSNLKLRVSYGVTGQQDGIGNYNYLPVYTHSQDGAEYQFGDTFYNTYRPEAYVSNLKWETTTSYNLGFDFGLLDSRISGSFDYYTRKTKDLLATVPSAAGSNFNKSITTNVGNVDSHGFEATINAIPLQTKDMEWDLSLNATYQKMKVTNLSLVAGSTSTNTLVGNSINSYQMMVLSEGYEPYMYYVYHQLYDAKGKPIEGAYADLNGDGQINSSDLYRYHSRTPNWIFGFSTSFRYKKWTASTSLRANVGNYLYNGMAMNTGAFGTVSYNVAQLNNMSSSYLKTGFQSRQFLSDYYVENASFIKMDNLSLSYDFGNITKWCKLHASAMVQNVFTITKYTGVDPEVASGIDMSFYPRPRTFSMSLGLDF
ncbi:MAG TPA: TonB-dependent receptor [Xylanibacter oryzae]|nr:TonB-dependent receptor [Xylanibacter oryzae]